MRGLLMTWSAALLMSGLFAAGCGSGSGGSSSPLGGGGAGGTPTGDAQMTDGPYEPLAVGLSLTYHVDDQGVKYDKVSTVTATEDAGGPYAGTTVFHLIDTFPADTQNTWYQVDGLLVKRLHDNDLDKAGNVKA